MNNIFTAETLCVGTEILIGDIVNTNAAFISSRLAALGINQFYQGVVGDNPERLKKAVADALRRCDLLVMSGGLGPTYDDLTKETVASVMGKPLVIHDRSLERLKRFFSQRSLVMSENNIKQAYAPDGAVVFDNDNGTAPGLAVLDEESNKTVILLPGPPSELIPMWNDAVEPYLAKRTDVTLVSRNINFVGIGESALEDMLAPLMKAAENPTVAPYCGEGEVRLRVTARAVSAQRGREMCDEMIEKIRRTDAAQYIYGVDTTLAAALIDKLKAQNMTVTAAESCTGGLLASMITAVPGASEVFNMSAVTYSNEAKVEMLGVCDQTLDAYGAVSQETAEEMAKGALNFAHADLALAITGVAGPGGGTEEKPVGTVYVAAALRGTDGSVTCRVRKNGFIGNRARVRSLSVTSALSLGVLLLKERISENKND